MSDTSVLFPEDYALVQRIRTGDAAAWNAFVRRYSDQVWRRAWQLCDEACPYRHRRSQAFCVFHALAADAVQPAGDDRPGCDEGLEVYAFIFEYFYHRDHDTGRLKAYDGRSRLDTFVAAVLRGRLRIDWIRHRRGLRLDQMTCPPEIQRLAPADRRVFEQMRMQRPSEKIARALGLTVEAVVEAQGRVAHALVANGNLHLILRTAERALDEVDELIEPPALRVLPMQSAVERLWEVLRDLAAGLPENEQILLDMAFDEELDASTMLDRCERLGLPLPVVPRSGTTTVHTIYQSIDAILRRLGAALQERHPDVLREAQDAIGTGAGHAVSVQGLKLFLQHMGLAAPPGEVAPSASRPAQPDAR